MTKRLFLALALLVIVFALAACSDGSKEVAGAWKTDDLDYPSETPRTRTLLIEGDTVVMDARFFTFNNVGYTREGADIVIHKPKTRTKFIVTVLDKDTIRVRCDNFKFERTYVRITPEELERIKARK